MTNIIKDILSHFERTTGKIDRIGNGNPYLLIKTDHGKAVEIGQYAMRKFPEQVRTYSICSIFRKAYLNIYFK